MLGWPTILPVLVSAALISTPAPAQLTAAQLVAVMQAITADNHDATRVCVDASPLGQESEGRSGVRTRAAELVAQQALDPTILQQQWTPKQTRYALRAALASSRPRIFHLFRGYPDEDRCKVVLAIEPPYVTGDKLLVRAVVGSPNVYGGRESVYLFELGAGQARLIAKGDDEIIVS